MPSPEAFQRLLGQELASVVFVRNYLQLEFDGPRLTLNIWPRLFSGARLTKGDAGYLESLVGLIGRTVTSVEDPDDSLTLVLDGSVTLSCVFSDDETLGEGDRVVFSDGEGHWAWA